MKLYRINVYDPCFDTAVLSWLVGARNAAQACRRLIDSHPGGDGQRAMEILERGLKPLRNGVGANVTELKLDWLKAIDYGILEL